MQARVTCPACQTPLGVSAAHGDGTLLRCPQCRHEFAIRMRPRAPAPAQDPLSRPAPSYQQPPAYQQPRPPVRPPKLNAPSSGGQSGSGLLWVGIGAGAAIAIACLVLTLVVIRMSGSDPQNVAANAPPADAPVMAPAAGAPATAAAAPQPSGAPAVAPPSVSPAPPAISPGAVASAAPAPSQPASSIGPQSPLAPSYPQTVPPPATSGAQLAYRFNAGEEYAYSFAVKADIAGTAQQANGTSTFTLSREAPPAEFAGGKTGQGNGSGFVVTSDGYIVTCAHVVEDSTKLEAVLGNQTYPAQVVAFDKEHDLAVIRVVAVNLPTVPLVNSDTVQLAEEVRAVGFPLSNVLGDSVKITRGTIAGVVNTSGHKLFQVDASINPGNSGGPLVNEKGEVVGVASAKIAREDVDGVGFVVPANDVLTLLRSKGISPTSGPAGQKLDGPALAKRVTPAVALIKVTVGPGGFGSSNRLLLDFSGSLTSSGAPRVVGRTTLPGFPNIEHDRGKLLVSERGEMLNYSANGNVQLPYLLGPVGALTIEPLSGDNQQTWRTQQATTLTQIVGESANSPFSMRFRHRSRSPFAQNQAKVVVTPAMETTTYQLVGTSGDLATIKKQYNFQTLDPAGSPPVARMTGEGTITFNRTKGYAEKMDFTATLVRSVSNVSVTVPLTLEWHRLSPAEIEQRRVQAQANQQAAQKAAAEREAKKKAAEIGDDTEFVGGTGGSPERIVDGASMVYGIECKFSEWMGEQCVQHIEPLFSPDQERNLPVGEVAKKGYAVGAVKVYGGEYVNCLQLIFMRVKGNGQLDPSDTYTGKVLGGRVRFKPHTLTGNGAPIIGIHIRKGLIVNALALIVNRDADEDAEEKENPFESGGSKKARK